MPVVQILTGRQTRIVMPKAAVFDGFVRRADGIVLGRYDNYDDAIETEMRVLECISKGDSLPEGNFVGKVKKTEVPCWVFERKVGQPDA